jgi:hypothetical protein
MREVLTVTEACEATGEVTEWLDGSLALRPIRLNCNYGC